MHINHSLPNSQPAAAVEVGLGLGRAAEGGAYTVVGAGGGSGFVEECGAADAATPGQGGDGGVDDGRVETN